jgi:organic radical activating enzyme
MIGIDPLMGYCNNRCSHCAYDSGPDREREEIDIDVLKDVIRQAVDLGCRHVQISGGGEPTLYSNFDELVTYLKELAEEGEEGHFSFSMFTNGWFVGSDMEKSAEKFREYTKMGFNYIFVSDSQFHIEQNPNIKTFREAYGSTIRDVGTLVFKNSVKEMDINGLGRARTELGITKSKCTGLFAIDDSMIVYPDGYYACCFHGFKFGELDEPLEKVVDKMKSDSFLNAMSVRDGDVFFLWLLGHYGERMEKEGLDCTPLDKISKFDMCGACSLFLNDSQYSEILKEASMEYLQNYLKDGIRKRSKIL